MGSYLGQNFLTDSKIRHYLGDKIKEIYNSLGCKFLIEIGPGKGSLTKLIYEISPDFFVIERDDLLIFDGKLKVEGLENVKVIHADVLDVDIEKELNERNRDPKKTLVVGNLPYYITSPILRKFFSEGEKNYGGGVFMVQKEVADKLCSNAEKKSYLWWIINYAYDTIYLKTVPAKAFSPAPKVTSALIEVKKKEHIPEIDFDRLLEFLNDFAPYSRKTLRSIATMLKKKKNKDWIIPQGLEGKRLEEMGWLDIGEILK